MNNLHRELAPISEEAWNEIEQEVARTFRLNVGGRRVVDVSEPSGVSFGALATGHQRDIDPPSDGVLASQRQVAALVELRAPFVLERQQIDAVERGAEDADWQPAKDAARRIALAEDGAICDGYLAAGIEGVRGGSSNPSMVLPALTEDFPAAIACVLGQLRGVGVDGPYSALLGSDTYTAVSGATDHGYPMVERIERLLGGPIVWTPAISNAIVLSTRGGDFELCLGQDLSIGYASHSETEVQLYLQETLTFLVHTSEAAVVLNPSP